MNSIYPIILSVPEEKKTLTGRDRVLHLSKYARDALELSAKKSFINLGNPLKDEKGVPMPVNGNYWSISHKPKYVAGVAARSRIGIDIEEIRECRESLFRKIADQNEWELTNTDKNALFFRYWTSKESVLKAVGTGLKDLSKCKITQIIDENNLAIDYMDKRWLIEHIFFNGHIASVIKDFLNIKWTVLKNQL
ncbi:MAG: 4'-phosphopantetheinyl transferase superfamily protein [Deltaproteobacteria bacterium]|nr:4'-phosphopantetheinyl transferase superfamily protein [Deltaproteobacteria bacterium]